MSMDTKKILFDKLGLFAIIDSELRGRAVW